MHEILKRTPLRAFGAAIFWPSTAMIYAQIPSRHDCFLDPERAKAEAFVHISSEGCKIVLEKRDGEWVALELKDRWIQ